MHPSVHASTQNAQTDGVFLLRAGELLGMASVGYFDLERYWVLIDRPSHQQSILSVAL